MEAADISNKIPDIEAVALYELFLYIEHAEMCHSSPSKFYVVVGVHNLQRV